MPSSTVFITDSDLQIAQAGKAIERETSNIISGYTGMMLTVDGWLLTVDSELEFTIPMLTDLI